MFTWIYNPRQLRRFRSSKIKNKRDLRGATKLEGWRAGALESSRAGGSMARGLENWRAGELKSSSDSRTRGLEG